MSTETINFGIDLGTTNSVISVLRGGQLETIKNGLSEITPSLVYIDRNGTARPGDAALNKLLHPPSANDVKAEFKRVMGQRVKLNFEAAGKSLTPEELSAIVLRELRRACGTRFGEEPNAAVITVPAMFELPQNDATATAGRLAGFTHCQLLQEPVAAAIAYGFQSDAERAYWLVYDYGGGTFDASIVAIRDGQLTVVKHAGDNYLGGADIDWKIAEQLLAPAIARDHGISNLSRAASAPQIARGRMIVLKQHAERIKKALSNQTTEDYLEDTVFMDDNGDPVSLACTITRDHVEQLAKPAVERSIEIVNKLIDDSGIPASKIDRMLLVGGSTFMPIVRERCKALGIPIGLELDPMTVVSRGAAIFASAQRVPATAARSVPVTAGTARVALEFEPLSRDLEPMVGGKVTIDDAPPPTGATIMLKRDDAAWLSGDVTVDSKGLFFTQAKIRPKGQTSFEIQVRRPDGQIVPVVPSAFAITCGLQVSNSPLSRGVGIARADGKMKIMHLSGEQVPRAEKIEPMKFVRGLRRGSEDSLRIPIMSGDETDAELNNCSGVIEIRGTAITRDIPAGADVDIAISVDASHVPHVRAFVPILDEGFELEGENRSYWLEHEPPAVMAERLKTIRIRIDAAISAAEDTKLTDVAAQARALRNSSTLAEIDALIEKWKAGERDAGGAAANQLVDLMKRVAALEAVIELPSDIAAFHEELGEARSTAATKGDADDRRAIDEVAKEAERAIASKDARSIRHCTSQLSRIKMQVTSKDPSFWIGFLVHLHGMQHKFPDRAAATRLFAEGAQAVERKDTESVRSVVQQLLRMLPEEVAAAVQGSIGSDVI
jgi:molecular chaperone DnaK